MASKLGVLRIIVSCPAKEFFTYMETSPLPIKDVDSREKN
jgi:hypothetical protein